MWTPEDVRERFVEASEIEHRMLVKGMPGSGNAWPAYSYDFEDMAGWDDAAKANHLEIWQGRKVTKSSEISRWEECFFIWTFRYITNPRARRMVWTWAHCMAHGPSFVSVCEKRGWVRRTEYARLERTFNNLAESLGNNDVLLRPAERIPLAVQRPEMHEKSSRIDADRPNDRQYAWSSEISVDLPEVRDFSWSESQVSRRARRLLNSGKAGATSTTSAPTSSSGPAIQASPSAPENGSRAASSQRS